MKKLFLVGALAASMAFSSSALAAVDFGEEGKLTASYDDTKNVVSVTSGLESYAEKQLTILIVDERETADVSDANIMYIDQDSFATGETIFQNMGLLMPVDPETKVAYETLPEGTYTVRVGGEGMPAILTATLTVTAGEDGPTYTLGDINSDGTINISDVGLLLNAYLGNVTLDETQTLAADVAPAGAPDGVINISDVGLVLNAYLGNATL